MTMGPAETEHKVRQLDNDVQSIYVMLAAIDGTQRRHSNRFQEITEQIDGKFAALGARIDTLDDKLTTLDGGIAPLDDKLTALDGGMDTLDGKVGDLDSKVGDLDGKLGALDGKLDAVLELLRSGPPASG